MARSFLTALLRFERGQIDERTRRELHRSATRHLARLVLGARPRQPQGMRPPSRGHVGAIEPLRGGRRRGELVATIERGGRRTALLLDLVRGQGRWLVASLH